MYNVIKNIHSYNAYIVLGLMILVVLYTLIRKVGDKPYNQTNKKLALYGLIASHIQFLVGMVLYFVSPLGSQMVSSEGMKNSEVRLYSIEHPVVMLIAVILVTIGYSTAKRKVGNAAYKPIFWFYLVALILMLSRIPWKMWLG